ncbi:MAG: hypothetical protein HKN07_12860 [Acidimicrobiia bacterium]|nr:hypothetical protein [Acidimicrobiia bacterium]
MRAIAASYTPSVRFGVMASEPAIGGIIEGMREFEDQKPQSDLDSDALASRLDNASRAVPKHMVDDVLHRAIELQLGEQYGLQPLDEDALVRIAQEVGIDSAHLRRALAEVRANPPTATESWAERMFAPDRTAASRTVAMSREEAETALVDWMRQSEGMRMRSRVADGALWEKDKHLLTTLRMTLRMGDASSAVRDARDVIHRVHPISPDEQVISLEADSSGIQTVGKVLLGVGAVGAVVGAGSVIGATDIGPLQSAAMAAGGLAVWSTAAVFGVRAWGRRLRDGLRRAVDGAAHPDIRGRDDSLAGQFDRLRREWTSGKRRRPL